MSKFIQSRACLEPWPKHDLPLCSECDAFQPQLGVLHKFLSVQLLVLMDQILAGAISSNTSFWEINIVPKKNKTLHILFTAIHFMFWGYCFVMPFPKGQVHSRTEGRLPINLVSPSRSYCKMLSHFLQISQSVGHAQRIMLPSGQWYLTCLVISGDTKKQTTQALSQWVTSSFCLCSGSMCHGHSIHFSANMQFVSQSTGTLGTTSSPHSLTS